MSGPPPPPDFTATKKAPSTANAVLRVARKVPPGLLFSRHRFDRGNYVRFTGPLTKEESGKYFEPESYDREGWFLTSGARRSSPTSTRSKTRREP